MPDDQVFEGYDGMDNDHFASESNRERKFPYPAFAKSKNYPT